MVKMQAVQSALAVRRQRSRREEVRKARQRRESGVSMASMTPRPSVVSIDGKVYFDDKQSGKSIFGHVTMFHVGGVLILIGLMLVLTALLPGYVKETTPERRSDFLGTGSFFVILGGVLTTVSRFVSNHEEKELHQYIQGRLARSRSSHHLSRGVEGGSNPSCYASPSRDRKVEATENGVGPPVQAPAPASNSENSTNPQGDSKEESWNSSSSCSSSTGEVGVTPPGYVVVGVDTPLPPSSSTEPVLSRILEEEEIELETDATTEPLDSTPESSITPSSPIETRGLLGNRHSPLKGSKVSLKGHSKNAKVT